VEIARCRFVDGKSDGREIGSNVMLEAAFANERSNFCSSGMRTTPAPQTFPGILGECAFADVAGDFPSRSLVENRAKLIGRFFHTPHDGAKGVLFADGFRR